MKTDSLFYKLFQTAPGAFFQLLGQPAGTATAYHYASVEIKQPNFRVDGVFQPNDDSPSNSIYFLEVQFQRKLDFYWRFFAEVFLYLEQEKPASNWQAVALFATRNLDPGLPIQYEALRQSHLKVLYLDEIPEAEASSPGMKLLHLVLAPPDQAVVKGARLLRTLKQEPDGAVVNREIINLVGTVLLYKFPAMSREELEAMFELEDLKHSKVYQEALEEGKREGKREGETKGKRMGKLETVPLLLQLGLDPDRIAQELGLEIGAVRRAAARTRNGKRSTSNGHTTPS